MHFMFKMSLTILAAIIACFGPANAEDGPLQCRYLRQQKQVKCRVMVDEAKVTLVTLNRGRCQLPEPVPAATQQKFKDLIGSLSQGDQVTLMTQVNMIDSYGNIPPKVYEAGVADWALNSPDQGTKLLIGSLLLGLDPTGDYKFGDTVEINPRNCDLLEYKIDVNGGEWTWTVQ